MITCIVFCFGELISEDYIYNYDYTCKPLAETTLQSCNTFCRKPLLITIILKVG